MGKKASQVQDLPLTQQRLLCANLANPALAGAARGRSLVAAAAPGLSSGHGLLRAIRGRGATLATVPGLSAEHGPLRVARSCGPAATAGLRWTCGPDSSAGGQWYRSLSAYLGDDDLFSSDLSDGELRTRLGHMSRVPCQVIFSMADEYIPEYVDKAKLLKSLSNRVQATVHCIIDFIKREGPKGWDNTWG
ncbi:unnamed protein product [Sphagnum troendelagicum]|uniref:Uncharacterized protein n=1 Tax=Sphagnum troendelagicum TaxID=128251 RepID=A0ABP0TKD9_9BRYO